MPGENSLTLSVNSVNWTHEGVYECIISTETREIHAEGYLNIQSKLNIHSTAMTLPHTPATVCIQFL